MPDIEIRRWPQLSELFYYNVFIYFLSGTVYKDLMIVNVELELILMLIYFAF